MGSEDKRREGRKERGEKRKEEEQRHYRGGGGVEGHWQKLALASAWQDRK